MDAETQIVVSDFRLGKSCQIMFDRVVDAVAFISDARAPNGTMPWVSKLLSWSMNVLERRPSLTWYVILGLVPRIHFSTCWDHAFVRHWQ